MIKQQTGHMGHKGSFKAAMMMTLALVDAMQQQLEVGKVRFLHNSFHTIGRLTMSRHKQQMKFKKHCRSKK